MNGRSNSLPLRVEHYVSRSMPIVNYRSASTVQIFSGLGSEEMTASRACARSLRKARGEFIYMPGDRADYVYILKQGRVKLSVLSESGKEIAIDIIQPGEIFGEFALVDESPRSNMAQALDDISCGFSRSSDFTQLLTAQPKLALSYIRLVGDRRRRMEKKLSDITSKASLRARLRTVARNFNKRFRSRNAAITSSHSHITTLPV